MNNNYNLTLSQIIHCWSLRPKPYIHNPIWYICQLCNSFLKADKSVIKALPFSVRRTTHPHLYMQLSQFFTSLEALPPHKRHEYCLVCSENACGAILAAASLLQGNRWELMPALQPRFQWGTCPYRRAYYLNGELDVVTRFLQGSASTDDWQCMSTWNNKFFCSKQTIHSFSKPTAQWSTSRHYWGLMCDCGGPEWCLELL